MKNIYSKDSPTAIEGRRIRHVDQSPTRCRPGPGQHQQTRSPSSWLWWVCALCAGAGPLAGLADEPGHHHERSPRTVLDPAPKVAGTNAPAKASPAPLPALPSGVGELKFSDFFVRPVGNRGLELTPKLRQLDGRRVRILGYMVREEDPSPGQFLLSPVPAQIHEHDNSLADDLPPSTLCVVVPQDAPQPVPFTPQLLLLTGTLSVGNRSEPDGRVSLARLTLDPPPADTPEKGSSAPSGKGAERLASTPASK
jgi:hypothetical protein